MNKPFLPINPAQNITTKFREAFEAYDNTVVWEEEKAGGDIIQVDGNAVAASYLVISKDPMTADSVSSIATNARFDMPLELALGVSMSQRTLGQEFAVEVISDDTPTDPYADVAILNASQTTTVLTVNTVTPHGLVPGKRFGIVGSPDSRLNYPALVVASIPSPTQFTASAGPGGTIPSLTIGAVAGGLVFGRSAIGGAQDGVSLIFESATATNGSAYVRSNAGDAFPSGAYVGNHGATLLTTASVQAINAAYTYAFLPSTEYRFTIQADRLQISDVAVDATGASNARLTRTQVIPNPEKDYRLRIRATNNKSYTVPTAQITTISKAGSTTATVNFDRPHGLTLTDQIILFGVRDQTNFPNLAVATAIASIVSPTAITVVVGASVTATSYGGFVARVQGGNVGIGAVAQAVSTAVLASGVLSLVGSAAWAGVSIGDYVNLVGVRDAAAGATLSVDGAWKVRNIATTTLELEPLPGTTVPADFVLVNAGGGVIRRTDIRIAYVRIFDYERERVELMPRPAGDLAGAVPTAIQNASLVMTSSASSAIVSAGNFIGSTTGNGLSTYRLGAALASNNAALVKASAGKLQGGVLQSRAAAKIYVKFYNKATAPVPATDTPVLTVDLAPGEKMNLAQIFADYGFGFATGIGIAIVAGAADNDNTAVAAGDASVFLLYA